MEKGKPHVAVELECPVHQEMRNVELEVNVFRRPDRSGLDVATCSEFLKAAGAPSCGKTCVHNLVARAIYEQEAERHREELALIGPNVIG